jgi:hypothetical protein
MDTIFKKIAYSMAGATIWAMLEHSSQNPTIMACTNVDPVLCHAVYQIPVFVSDDVSSS